MATTGTERSRGMAGRLRLSLLVMALALAVSGTGAAHPIQAENGYFDGFDTVGPLPSAPDEPWQVATGSWNVTDQANVQGLSGAGTSKVLVQSSRAVTPADPIAFVRARPFRSFTAQVTGAVLDDVTNASIGIVFRAPIDTDSGIADKDNLYLFSADNTGIIGPFTTGHAFILWKRIGRGYYMQAEKIVNTYTDITKPHDYKVVMSGGHIQAFVDGRKVIEHTDVPSGDTPSKIDQFPGLPFDSGAVGLRTSGTRAWFDNFKLVGTNAYEARAAITDNYTSYQENNALRRGHASQLSNTTRAADTGFVYHDHDFDEAIIRPFENQGGSPAGGISLRAYAKGGKVVSEARLTGISVLFKDITQNVVVEFRAAAAEIAASASCTSVTSNAVFYDGELTVTKTSSEGTGFHVIGPIPVRGQLAQNTTVIEQQGVFKVMANVVTAGSTPRRGEATLLKVEFPDKLQTVGPFRIPLPLSIPGSGSEVNAGEVGLGRSPHFEQVLGHVVAGRYCN